MYRLADILVLAALLGGCNRARDERANDKGSPSAVPSTPASATPRSSAASVAKAASAPSANATVEPVPLSGNASDRPKLVGAVAFVATVKGEGPALYAASLAVIPLEAKRLAENGTDWSIGEPALDPTGKAVLFTHDHHENSSAPPDEVWAVPTAGGAPHRIAQCTATCRSPHFLEDGRILYVDHGVGLNSAVIRMVTATGKLSALYGGDPSISACFVGLDVDPFGKYVAVRVSNDLGWPECKTDRSLAASASDLKLLTLPASVPGRSGVQAGSDGRVYFVGGTDESPIPSSIKIDGTGLRAPEPLFDGKRFTRPGWYLEVVGTQIVAYPPVGDSRRPAVLFEADAIDALYQTPLR